MLGSLNFKTSEAILVAKPVEPKPKKVLEVRLTVYWKEGSGTDGMTARGQSATGISLVEGHCAVDPKIIPYGSEVHLPQIGKTLLCVDTGGDVKKRRASRGLYPVIDIYFVKKSEALQFASTHPLIVKAEIF